MAGVHSLGGGEGQVHHGFVRRESHHIHAGHLAHLIAEVDAVKIVVHGVPAYHQVSDIQVGVQGTGNTGIHQMRHPKDAAQDLGAHGGIDLAHAALDHHSVQSPELSLTEFHARVGGNLHSLHVFLQKRHFHSHGADNT